MRLWVEIVLLKSLNSGLVRWVIQVIDVSSVRCMIIVVVNLSCCVWFCCVVGSFVIIRERKIMLLILSIIFSSVSVLSVSQVLGLVIYVNNIE